MSDPNQLSKYRQNQQEDIKYRLERDEERRAAAMRALADEDSSALGNDAFTREREKTLQLEAENAKLKAQLKRCSP